MIENTHVSAASVARLERWFWHPTFTVGQANGATLPFPPNQVWASISTKRC